VIRTIRLTLADIDEAQALVAVDDERRRPGDVVGGEPETVIDPVALDHRSIRVDEDRQGQPAGMVIVGYFIGALADDHQHLSSQGLIRRQMGLQLFQLLAAVRSPGAADERDDHRAGADNVCQPNFPALIGKQRERRGHIAELEWWMRLCHLSSSSPDAIYGCARSVSDSIRFPRQRRQRSFDDPAPLLLKSKCAMFVSCLGFPCTDPDRPCRSAP
jgi:hypothetical protein